MSYTAMSDVWARSRSTGSARLVLLAIADLCSDGGLPQAWPTVARLMQRTGLGERTVQTALRGLEQSGELHVTLQNGKPSIYTLCLAADAAGLPLPVLDPDGLANRRAAIRQSQFRRIADRDGWTCQHRGPRCTGHLQPTVGHIIPIAAGGSDDDDNLQIECVTCNTGKAAR